MSRTYLLLQKKLHELESEFTHLSNHLGETSSPDHVEDNFRRRLVFLRNLLIAEMAVHPFKPNHLIQIKDVLDELEAAFCQRYAHMNSFDGVQSVNDLACSCNEPRSLNEGGEGEGVGGEEGLGVYETPEEFGSAVVAPMEEKMFKDPDMEWDEGRKEKDGGGSGGAWWRKVFRVMAIWMILGAILMVNFSKLLF